MCTPRRPPHTPRKSTRSTGCVLPHSMQTSQTSQKLEHAKQMNDGVQKHARLFRRADELQIECRRATEENHHLKREITKHKAALADAKSIIDDMQHALLVRVPRPPVAPSAPAAPSREEAPLPTSAAQSLSGRAEDRDQPEGGLGWEEPRQRNAVFVRAAKLQQSDLSAPISSAACNNAEGAVRPVLPQLSPASASSSSKLGTTSQPSTRSPSPCRSYDEEEALEPTSRSAPPSPSAPEQAQLVDAASSVPSTSGEVAATAGGGLSTVRDNARPRRQMTNSACLREPSLGSKLRQGGANTFGTPRPTSRRPAQEAKVQNVVKTDEDAGGAEVDDGKAKVHSDAAVRKWGAAAQGRSSVLDHMFR